MGLSGTLTADFSSFSAAVDSAVVKLNDFEANSGKVTTALNKVSNSLNGNTIVAQATIMAEAVDRIGGVSMLTEAELARVGATATEAAAKLTAMGQTVPPGIQAIADAANNTTQSFSAWTSSFNIKDAIADPIGTAKEGMLAFADSLGPTGIAMAAAGGAAVAIGAGLFELASKAAAAGEAVEAFAAITGADVSTIGALGASATIAGGSLDGMQTMLEQMQRKLDATGPAAEKVDEALAKINISAVDFRAADPADRIQMLATGMQNATDPTERMSVALAVMGRSGAEQIPVLMKMTDAVREAGEQYGFTWSDANLADVRAFSEAQNTLGVQMSTITSTIGTALTPAFTYLMGQTTELISETERLAALIATPYTLLADAFGRTALAQQTEGAVTDSVSVLWANAAKAGLDLNDATYVVANQMLTLGYNQKTVAEQTGLAAEDIAVLATNMKRAATAGEEYAAANDRVNTALTSGAPSLAAVDQSTKGWVVDMNAANVTMKDMIATSGLNEATLKLIIASQNEAEKAATAWTTAQTNLNAVGATWQATLATVNPGLVEDVTQMLAAGASAKDLGTAWGILPSVMTAIQDSIKAQDAALAFDAKQTEQNVVAWDAYALGVVKATGTATDAQLAANAKTFNDAIAKLDLEFSHVKVWTDETTAQYEAAYAAKAALNQQANDAILNDDKRVAAGSIEALSQVYQKQVTTLNDMMTGDLHYSQAAIQNQRNVVQAAQDAMNGISAASATTFGGMTAGIGTTTAAAGSLTTALSGVAAAVTTVTTDVIALLALSQSGGGKSGPNTVAPLGDMPGGYTKDQWLAFFANIGPGLQFLHGYNEFGNQYKEGTGGFVDFGAGTLAMLHGLEAVIPINAATSPGISVPFGSQTGLSGGTMIQVVIQQSGVLGMLDAPSAAKLGQIAATAVMSRLRSGRPLGN